MTEVGNKYKPELLESYTIDRGVHFTMREQQYIVLASNGMSLREVALHLRCSTKTLQRMLAKNAEIQKAVDCIKSNLIAEVADRRKSELEELYDKAQSKIAALLDDPNPWIAMQAMRMVFDRHDKMFKVTEEEDNKIAIVFEGMAVPPTRSTIEGHMEDE